MGPRNILAIVIFFIKAGTRQSISRPEATKARSTSSTDIVIVFLSGPWMRSFVHGHQSTDVEMRVALSRAEARVAKQFLNGAQIGARLKQMRRESVPERVGTDALIDGRFASITTDDSIDASCGESSAAEIDEKRLPSRGMPVERSTPGRAGRSRY